MDTGADIATATDAYLQTAILRRKFDLFLRLVKQVLAKTGLGIVITASCETQRTQQ